MDINPIPNSSSEGDFATEVSVLWREVLGAEAEVSSGFLESGGDSFRAVLLARRIFDLTGREIDYLDVLEADGATALSRLLAG